MVILFSSVSQANINLTYLALHGVALESQDKSLGTQQTRTKLC